MAHPLDKRALLIACIEQESASLFAILGRYVTRMGLAPYPMADQVTQELVNQVVVEALQNAHRFDPSRRPVPWLLGIGINLIREQLRYRAHHPEIAARDLFADTQAALSDDELFERFDTLTEAGPAGQVEQELVVAELLAQLSEEDGEIVRLAILNDLDSAAVGRQLGITPGAARVRLHRAVQRLRSWFVSQGVKADE
ncbi:MAG: sigma-70 family RNA polymerase sigma factor [Chloroflexi bacterium]|nr:sigma-70 family RNA polymerase sigma factor [Chloroflexota bacterium]